MVSTKDLLVYCYTLIDDLILDGQVMIPSLRLDAWRLVNGASAGVAVAFASRAFFSRA